jgi:AcrR family transcriptional regulator
MPRPAHSRSKPPPPPRRQPRGQRTREVILRRAVNLASVEGLEGLTVGRLADDLKMSKSGLFAHFGSKEELQLATVETARQIFIDQITLPALRAPKGLPRLWNLIDSWLGHVEGKIYAGGCFFTAASFEFDDRRGLVRDRIAAIMREWMAALKSGAHRSKNKFHVARARSAGHWTRRALGSPVARRSRRVFPRPR